MATLLYDVTQSGYTGQAFARATHEAQLDAVHSGRCHVVEGPVTGLKVAGFENHKNVSFQVGDAAFDYQENRLDGFRELPRDGGPFGEGTPVRNTACPDRGPRQDVARFEVL